jgi:hypothetical protein
VAGIPKKATAQDHYFLGTGRHLLHARGRRVLSQGSPPVQKFIG